MTISAQADIKRVRDWIYTASLNEKTATQFAEKLVAACIRIGDHPFVGRARDDLRQGLRTFAFERRAVIAYLVHEDVVEIVNIFYGGRDIDAFYRNEA